MNQPAQAVAAAPVAMVTGAGRGIGRATAFALTDAGFSVGLVARTRVEVEETAAEVTRRGGEQCVAIADVTDASSVANAVATVERHLAPIDVLVNNAGTMSAIGPVWEVDPDDWWTDVETSLRGTFICCRAVVAGMISRRRGRIVNLTSYAAMRPSPYQSGYSAAKAGVTSLTEALAASLEQHGVSAFAVAPAFTDTKMTRTARDSAEAARWLPRLGEHGAVDGMRSAALIAWLAGGFGDVLNGRVVHTLDDAEMLVERFDEILRLDLYAPRLRRLD
jgi:NAD(P)-dependent dehydrogenase (short-subunit alcohol dehydrogenase family)